MEARAIEHAEQELAITSEPTVGVVVGTVVVTSSDNATIAEASTDHANGV